ncbi:MAG: aspartate carbamoyltransferase [Dehalococcoidia bacterium]|nr:aspartate carbamoyltransferase [Dehalococcoidia bacterium]
MTIAGRDLISINDFSNEEIQAVLDLADEMNSALKEKKRLDLCQSKELYTIFYEPSTRTRSSFETAMHRLGGNVVSHAEAQVTSSATKGETISDTVRVLDKYADIIVMRHPLDGSTRLAAEHCSVPIISGGDGAHEHPTQTLVDLYTIGKERGSIKGKNVALCGDLRHGRTVHSLAIALARFGAHVTCIAPPGFELPEHIHDGIKAYKGKITEYRTLAEIVGESALTVKHQKGFSNLLLESIDVFYFTRLQRERISGQDVNTAAQESYRINQHLLEKSRKDAIIMHPLPRTNELAYEFDQDERAAYFRQAGYGVPVRMALIALLLGVVEPKIEQKPRRDLIKLAKDVSDVVCSNRQCVTNTEKYAPKKFYRVPGAGPQVLRCYYCDWLLQNG